MARRTYNRRAKAVATEPQMTCRDCKHSYDWHEKGWDGKPFMCRCQYYTDGKFCRFLNDPQCENFQLRPQDNATSN